MFVRVFGCILVFVSVLEILVCTNLNPGYKKQFFCYVVLRLKTLNRFITFFSTSLVTLLFCLLIEKMTVAVESAPITSPAPEVNETKEDKFIYNEDDEKEQKDCEKIFSMLTEQEVAEMPDPMMPRRYLRAEKGNIETAVKRLKETLVWRKEFGVDKVVADDELHKFENATGKMYTRGYDKDGCALLYIKPGLENSSSADGQIMHVVYTLERAIAATAKNTGGKEEKINLVVDFVNFSLFNSHPLSTRKRFIHILQSHYPERLKRAFLCSPPGIFKVFWKISQPFLDPVTKDKVVMCHGEEGLKRACALFDDIQKVELCAGGQCTREYDSKTWLESDFDVTFDE